MRPEANRVISHYFDHPLPLAPKRKQAESRHSEQLDAIQESFDQLSEEFAKRNKKDYVLTSSLNKLQETILPDLIEKTKSLHRVLVSEETEIQQPTKRRRSESKGDVNFVVGDEKIRASSIFLMTLSKKLQQLIDNKNELGEITISGYSFETMKKVVKWAEQDRLTLSRETVVEVYAFADEYHVKGLERQCEIYLREQYGPEDFVGIMEDAFRFPQSSLMRRLRTAFVENPILQRPIPYDLFVDVIKNYSGAATEIYLFNLACEYIYTSKLNDEQIKEILSHIRFSLVETNSLLEIAQVKINDKELYKYVPDYLSYLVQAHNSKPTTHKARPIHYKKSEAKLIDNNLHFSIVCNFPYFSSTTCLEMSNRKIHFTPMVSSDKVKLLVKMPSNMDFDLIGASVKLLVGDTHSSKFYELGDREQIIKDGKLKYSFTIRAH